MSPTPEHCRLIVPLLRSRDGHSTQVILSGERSLNVFNIAWGGDMGDAFEHLTTNISPPVADSTIDLFFTDEVRQVVDPVSGAALWETDGIPIQR